MKSLGTVICALLFLLPASFAATITGNISDSTATALNGVSIEFYPKDAPYLQGPNLTLARPVKTLSTNGNWTINLNQGQYMVTMGGSPVGAINVPAGTGTYTFDQVTGTFVYLGQPGAYGLVAVASNDTPGFLLSKLVSSQYISVQGLNIGGTNAMLYLAPIAMPGNLISGLVNVTNLSPPGSSSQIIFNLGGAFGTATNFYFDGTNLFVPSVIATNLNLAPPGANQQVIYNGSGHFAAVGQFSFDGTNLFVPALQTTNLVVIGTGSAAPSTSSSAGLPGDFAWDTNYIYLCVATNTWKRTAVSTW